MTGAEIALFAYLILGASIVLFVVVEVVPSVARDRLLVRLGELRDELRAGPFNEPSQVMAHRDVAVLDGLLTRALHRGMPLGLTWVVTAYTLMRRSPAERARVPALTWAGLSHGDRVILTMLERQTYGEIVRASLLGSRLWLLTGIAWWFMRPLFRVSTDLDAHPHERETEQVFFASLFIGESPRFPTPAAA